MGFTEFGTCSQHQTPHGFREHRGCFTRKCLCTQRGLLVWLWAVKPFLRKKGEWAYKIISWQPAEPFDTMLTAMFHCWKTSVLTKNLFTSSLSIARTIQQNLPRPKLAFSMWIYSVRWSKQKLPGLCWWRKQKTDLPSGNDFVHVTHVSERNQGERSTLGNIYLYSSHLNNMIKLQCDFLVCHVRLK